MNLNDLQTKIEDRSAKVAVIGLGYVGLPVAAMFADKGFEVLGLDIKKDRIDKINSGISPIKGNEPGLDELLKKVISQKLLHASTNYSDLSDRDIILIDVETPVDEQNIPRYEALHSVIDNLAPVMKQNVLVIVESTIAPGTMKNVVHPLLEEKSGKVLNQDFYLGNCPERVMPGKLLHNLANLSRVVGGSSEDTSRTMVKLYSNIVNADLDPTDWITAELVKTVENSYRDVQIAFANEVAMICEALDGNVWKVRELVNKSPFRNMHLPGAGVGGHCIPKDPWLLAYGVSDFNTQLNIIPAARHVNDSMPLHLLDLLFQAMSSIELAITGSTILVLGYSYLEESDDTRNSPSKILVDRLKALGVNVLIHDPYVKDFQTDLWECVEKANAVVLMVAHDEYKRLDLKRLKQSGKIEILVDGRHIFKPEDVMNAGIIYRGVGWGYNQKEA